MSRHVFNGLEVEVPDGWEDQTLVTFVSPPEAMHAAPLTGMRPDEHRASVVIKRIVLPEPMTPEEMGEAYEHIHVATTGAVVVARGVIELDGDRSATTRSFDIDGPEGPMRQLHVHLDVNNEMYTIFGTAPADLNFKALEKTCARVARSLRRR